MDLDARGVTVRDILTDAAVRNAMVTHAAFGGSTNLLLHLPAIAHAAGLRRPTAREWAEVNREVPRLVDALPNGPRNHPTVEVFLAGGVPGSDAAPAPRRTARHGRCRPRAASRSANSSTRGRRPAVAPSSGAGCGIEYGVDPDDVIMSPESAKSRGLTSTICFPHGQSRAGGIGHQEHGDRSVGDWIRRRVSTDRTGEGLSQRAGGDCGDQGEADRRLATCWSSSGAVRWVPAWKKRIS